MIAQKVSLAQSRDAGKRPVTRDRDLARGCFLAGTRIRTPFGPRKVEDLLAGDLIQSCDDRIVVLVARRVIRRKMVGLVRMPGQGGHKALWVLPAQKIAHRDWRTELLYGGRAMVAAGDLVDGLAVRRGTRRDVTLYELECVGPCVVRANGRDVRFGDVTAAGVNAPQGLTV